MKRSNKWVAGTMALALTFGGVWASQSVSAETNTSSQVQGQDGSGIADKPVKRAAGFGMEMMHARGGKPAGGFLHNSEELLKLLGLTSEELKESLQSGKSLAEIAGEKGIDVQAVIDLQAAKATAVLDQQKSDGKLTEEQYNERKVAIVDAITEMVNGKMKVRGEFPGGKEDFVGEKGLRGHRGSMIRLESEQLLNLLGMTGDELKQAMKDGKTLAAIADEKGVDVQSVIQLYVEQMTGALDRQLEDGKLTEEQYNTRKAELADEAAKWVNGEKPSGEPEGMKPKGRGMKGAFPGGKGQDKQADQTQGTTETNNTTEASN